MILSDRFIAAGTEKCELTHPVNAPYMRKNFCLPSPPERAELTVCGLGFYELFVNGIRLTASFLAPYVSNSDQVLDYDRYEIAPYLREGKNTLAFLLGNGMQNSFSGYVWDFDKASFRSAPKLAVRLDCACADGSSVAFEADESFVTSPSPIVSDDLRAGECFDARLKKDGWTLPDFDDSGWAAAVPAQTPRGEKTVRRSRPIVRTEELSAVDIRPETLRFSDRPDVYEGILYDFGINTTGVCRLKIRGKRGQHIRIIFGEMLGEDGHLTVDNIRFDFMRSEYRQLPIGMQSDEYICAGEGEECYTPCFTYHGFRYALVCGLEPEQQRPDTLTFCVMHADLEERGDFACSDPCLNRLVAMTKNSILSNFWHFPTDCPHREKNGWTADAALSAEACMLYFSPEDSYREWLLHIRRAMREDGALPGIVPTGGWGFEWGNGPAWDQVLPVLVTLLYRFTGEKRDIEENLDALLRYCRYLETRRDERGLLAIGLGDWCAPVRVKAPLRFTDSVIAMATAEKTARLAEIVGRTEAAEDCRKLARELRTAVRTHLIDRQTCTADGACQTSQAMALYYHIFEGEERAPAFARLKDFIDEQDGHIDCGVLGARVLFRVLTDFYDCDTALSILRQKTAPSYGEWVARGETTLMETFDTDSPLAMSRNHHFFGDIIAWFMQELCGIHVNDGLDDLSRVDIRPHFSDTLDHCRARHRASVGEIRSEWTRVSDKSVFLSVVCPRGAHGTIRAPRGYVFSDASLEKPALTGGYLLLKS